MKFHFPYWVALSSYLLISGCSVTPTLTPTTTETVAPQPTYSPTSLPATATAALMPTATPSPAATRSAGATSAGGTAAFIAENYPDGSVLEPGESFTKTFELQNTGHTTWTSNYHLVLQPSDSGETFGSLPTVAFPQQVPAGEKVTLSIPLVAPSTPGTYTVSWKLQDEQGSPITVDGGALIWVKVQVCDPALPCPTAATTTSGGSSASVAGGITMTLSSFTYTDDNATVAYCMNLPNQNYTPDHAPELLIDQQKAPYLSGEMRGMCSQFTYQTSSSQIESAHEIVLSVAKLIASPPPSGACDSARSKLSAQYSGLDFQCTDGMGVYYTNLKLPVGMTSAEADVIIMDQIQSAIYGPWELQLK